MKTSDIFIVQPKTEEQVSALKAFMNALNIDFTISQNVYDPDFVEKILESREQAKNEEVIRVKKEDLNEFLGLWYELSFGFYQ